MRCLRVSLLSWTFIISWFQRDLRNPAALYLRFKHVTIASPRRICFFHLSTPYIFLSGPLILIGLDLQDAIVDRISGALIYPMPYLLLDRVDPHEYAVKSARWSIRFRSKRRPGCLTTIIISSGGGNHGSPRWRPNNLRHAMQISLTFIVSPPDLLLLTWRFSRWAVAFKTTLVWAPHERMLYHFVRNRAPRCLSRLLLGKLQAKEVDWAAALTSFVLRILHPALQMLNCEAIDVTLATFWGHLNQVHILFNHQLLHEAARLRVRLLYRSRLLLDAAFDFHAIHIKRDVALRAPSNHCIRLLGVGQDNLAILIC